jgi:mannonate dehydratase
VSYISGIQEYTPFNVETKEIFQGCPEMKDGYFWVNERPGWGIEVDEKVAAKFPFSDSANQLNGGWGEIRKRDGTVIKQLRVPRISILETWVSAQPPIY